jgi:magnesium-transporting ATPase (P-type)
MLWRLLFVHGRWNYIRISEMILYFFYKNMLFTFPQLIAAFFNGFSGQTLFDDIYITLYNLIFTAIPLLIRAVLEQDVNYIYQRLPEAEANEPPITQKSLIQEMGYLPERFGINKNFYRLFPKVYFIGQENCIFNYKNFFMWLLEGAIEAVLITLFAFYILGEASLSQDGYNSSYWLVGLTMYALGYLATQQ